MAVKLDFVDVSWHNKIIPWNRFRDEGVKGGICKVMDGYFMAPDYTGHIDPQFKTNWQALDTFELRGGYGFNRFDTHRTGGLTPAMQMKLCIATIGDHKETDILAWDVEQKPWQIEHISLLARAHMLADALKVAEQHWDKEYIWPYTGKWWWNKQMPKPHIDPMPYICSFPLWAAYYNSAGLRWHVPMGWKLEDVIAHQYSMTKKIAGVTIDHNHFRWDWDDYLKIEPPAPPPEPEPEPEPDPEPIPEPPIPVPQPAPPRPPKPIPQPPKPPKSWWEMFIEWIIRLIKGV